MNGCIIPEENEKSINPQQENAIFLVMGDEAYTDEMIDEYNRNAEAKTEEFNTNATNKLNAFNENATTKTNAFNTNATTQTDTYNSNAATKLSEYNDNAAAKEQSYNSNADTKTQAFNQNAAQKEYEFNQNALAYQEGIEKNAEEIDEVSNRVYRIENNLYDSGTAEGNFINIEDSSYSEFQNVNIDGASEQETTSGQNIYNFEDTMDVSDGVIVDEDGYITFTYDNSQGVSTAYLNYFSYPISLLKPNTNYSFFVEVKSISGNGYLSITSSDATSTIQQFVIPEMGNSIDFNSIRGNNIIKKDYMSKENLDDNSITVGVRTFVGMNSGDSGSITLRISILEDTAKTPETFIYEPYTGGQPSPSPDYPQPIGVIEEDFNITSCGKNLLNLEPNNVSGVTIIKNDDDSFYINGTINDNWVNITKNTNDSLELNKNYCFSIDHVVNHNVQLRFNYEDNSYQNFIITSGKQSVTFSLSKKAINYYIYFYKDYGLGSIDDTIKFQLEVGTEPTSYEPYQGTTTTIALPEGQFAAKISDTIKDQFRIVYNESDGNYHLYLDKNVGKVVLDGSEDWFHYNSGADENNTYPIATDNISTSTNEIIVMSNNFVAKSASYLYSNDAQGIGNSFTQLIVRVDKKTATTIEEWKTWLQLHNTIVYYQLANPQTIDIGKVQMPLTYYPVTNVFTDCPLLPTIEVAYYRDFKTTIEAMQKDIASNTSRIETLEEQLQSQATTISNLENRVTALEPTQTESEVVEQ